MNVLFSDSLYVHCTMMQNMNCVFLIQAFFYFNFLCAWHLFFYISLKNSGIPWFRDYCNFSFFLSNTFVYEPILLKLSINVNIVKMQIFHKIKYDLRGHSRSQKMTFLIKNSPFLLFMLLIIWKNKCRWTLWKVISFHQNRLINDCSRVKKAKITYWHTPIVFWGEL